MPVRIHQLLAIISGVNTETDTALARVSQVVAKPELFSGMEKESVAASDSVDPNHQRRRVTPDVKKKVAYTAVQVLDDVKTLLTAKWDTALTLDTAQGAAKADVVVGPHTVMHDVPVRHLVYLEGELTKLHAIVQALPVLNGVQDWTNENTEPGQWRSVRPQEGDLKDKVMFNWHRGNGTPTIQEQVDVMTRDEIVEYNTTVSFSGALEAKRKAELLDRLSALRTAVKMAREEANSATVTERNEGAEIFSWLLRP
ncbi:MAG TPA: hypothetical protein VGG75_38095 [Trebonia sp.]|jgi:hypothetical protein